MCRRGDFVSSARRDALLPSALKGKLFLHAPKEAHFCEK